jgi:hypothetical protein
MLLITESGVFLSGQHAIFVRYDHISGDKLAVYDGSAIKIYEYPPENIEQIFSNGDVKTFGEDISNMHMLSGQIYVVFNNSVYRLGDDDQLEAVPNFGFVIEMTSDSQSIAAILIPIAELALFMLFLFLCNLKVYRTPSGRMFIEPAKQLKFRFGPPRRLAEPIKEELAPKEEQV